MVSQAHRSGSQGVYSSHWFSLASLVPGQRGGPLQPLLYSGCWFLGVLLQIPFFLSVFIWVHRATICTTLRHLGGSSLSDDPLHQDLVRSASIRDASNPRRTPSWTFSWYSLPCVSPHTNLFVKFLSSISLSDLCFLWPSPLAENVLRCMPWTVCPQMWHLSQMDLFPTVSFPSSLLRTSLLVTLPPSSMSSPSPPFSALTTKSVPFAPSRPWRFTGGGPTLFARPVAASSSPGMKATLRTSDRPACLGGQHNWLQLPMRGWAQTCRG